MMQIYTVLRWSGGVILAAIVVILFILDFRETFRNRIRYRIRNVPVPKAPRFELALASLPNSVVIKSYATGFWIESRAINAARIEAIKNAQRSIHFETFVITPGSRANDFATAIAQRA